MTNDKFEPSLAAKEVSRVGFELEHAEFINFHCKRRTGERLRRLREGHGHAERRFLETVWWPTFHHFHRLHPEYEVHDYRDGFRYIDFAYIQPYFRMAIEIDGIGPHWRNISRWQFSDHCQRQNHLVIDGWHVLRFSYDDVNEQPRTCQQTIQQLMGRWQGNVPSSDTVTLPEREIIRLATRSHKPITPRDVCSLLDVGPDYAQKLLRTLTHKQWLQPATGTVRIRSYKLNQLRRHIRL